MAYPSVTGPCGLLPINLIGGQVFAGATRLIPIATNSSTAIYYGDVVKLGSDGTLSKDTGTNAATPVGVFLGCTYTDPVYGKTFRQYYAGTTNITDIVAYVQDDPDALFKVAVVSTGTNISYVARANVGENAVLAMPETAIGFFPDIGASHFLSRLPGRIGLYLALTGLRLNAVDAVYAGLATHFVPAARFSLLLDRLAGGERPDRILADLAADPGPVLLGDFIKRQDQLHGLT